LDEENKYISAYSALIDIPGIAVLEGKAGIRGRRSGEGGVGESTVPPIVE
jgi:hypothetical protein